MATDNFNRANSNSMGANWTEKEDANDADKTRCFEIDSNQLAISSTRGLSIHKWGYAFWTADLGGHHSSEATYRDFSANGVVNNGLAVRCSTTGTANLATLYGAFYKANSGQPKLQLRKYVSQSLETSDGTIIGTVTVTLVNGDRLRLTAAGPNISVHRNGLEILLVVDTSIPSGGRSGFACKDAAVAGSTTFQFWDDWEGLAASFVDLTPATSEYGKDHREHGGNLDIRPPLRLKEKRHYSAFARVH